MSPAQVLPAVIGSVAVTASAAALVAGGLTLVTTRRPATALGVLLDLLLVAGLLRLTGNPGWPTITAAAVVVLLRHLIGTGLRLGARAWSGDAGTTGPPRLRALRRRVPTGLARDLLRPAWHR